MPSGGMPAMGIHQQQAMLAHQNSNMEMMERRQRERQAAERTANSQAVRMCFSPLFTQLPLIVSFHHFIRGNLVPRKTTLVVSLSFEFYRL